MRDMKKEAPEERRKILVRDDCKHLIMAERALGYHYLMYKIH